ncbi:hypothetical protein PFISCL1PPCAC_15120, partial [Pristionchus fissidentatus]
IDAPFNTMIWIFLPLFVSAHFIEKSSKKQLLFNLTTPYGRPQTLKVNATSRVEIRLSSCQFNPGELISSSKDAEIVLYPRDLLRILTDTSKGCPVDPFYGEPTANASVYVSITTKDLPANYSINWLKRENGVKFEVNSSRYFTQTFNVQLRKGLFLHTSLSLNSSIEVSIGGCVQQQGFFLFNLSSPSSHSLNLTSTSLVDLIEKILCPSDSLLYHGDNIDLYLIIKSRTPFSSGLLHISHSVDDGSIMRNGPRIKRNIDTCFSLEEKKVQYSHIDPIEGREAEEIQLDVYVKSGRVRLSILGCDDSPPLSMGEFIPGMHSIIMNSILESIHCNYTVKTGFPISLEGIVKSSGQIKLRVKEDSTSTILFKLEYVIILVLVLLLIFLFSYFVCYRFGIRRRAKAKISSEKKPSISVIETSWH